MKQGYAEDRRTMEANVRVARFLSGISCSTLIGACVVVTEESATTAFTKLPYFTRNLDNNVMDSGERPTRISCVDRLETDRTNVMW